MPKTASPKLFQLIKAMTGSEKRYFKLYIGDKKKKYIQLFDAIEAQEQFDDEIFWDDKEKNKGAILGVEKKNFDIDNKENWEEYFKWLLINAERLKRWMTNYLEKNTAAKSG